METASDRRAVGVPGLDQLRTRSGQTTARIELHVLGARRVKAHGRGCVARAARMGW
jgi:hypothetical protein